MHDKSANPPAVPGNSSAANAIAGSSGDPQRAAVGPAPEPVSTAANPAAALPADSPAEAEGRRTLSTAFVRVGPDNHLTVELRSGRVLVLRDVVMRPRDFCGVQVPGGAKYCGGYAEIATARPGGAPAPLEPGPAVFNPLELPNND